MDETDIKVKGEDKYLQEGSRFDWQQDRTFYSQPRGTHSSAKRFFRKTLQAAHTIEPRVINVDKNADEPQAIDEMKVKEELPVSVELRQKKYLNNLALAGLSIYQATGEFRHGI